MLLKSYSKINLSLNIFKKMRRLHDIQSFFCLVNIFDEINIKKNKKKKDMVSFKGKFGKSVNRKKNSLIVTLSTLRSMKLINNYYDIKVNKKIPVFAGMGGGTSNSATLAKFLLSHKIKKRILNKLKKKIGSDLNIFFYKQGFIMNLEKIVELKKKINLYFILVYPNFKSPTKKVYQKVKIFSKRYKIDLQKIKGRKDFIKFLSNRRNCLQSIEEKKHSIITKLLMEIEGFKGCHFSRMTGSGSVCFGVFSSDKWAREALKKIKIKYPQYWAVVAKTI